jgi:hypothetical protein
MDVPNWDSRAAGKSLWNQRAARVDFSVPAYRYRVGMAEMHRGAGFQPCGGAISTTAARWQIQIRMFW